MRSSKFIECLSLFKALVYAYTLADKYSFEFSEYHSKMTCQYYVKFPSDAYMMSGSGTIDRIPYRRINASRHVGRTSLLFFFLQTTTEKKNQEEWVSQWICSKTHDTCSSHVVFFLQHCHLDRLACIPLCRLDTISSFFF